TGDLDTAHPTQIQCNPIIIDGVLYGTTPQMKLFAVDAATGKQKWIYNPFDTTIKNNPAYYFMLNTCRGITYWTDGSDDKRIFYTAGSFLNCVNAVTGQLVKSFGTGGKLDLHDNLGRDVKDLFVTSTSAGMIYKDMIIIGTRVDEGANAAPGHIRAFDVHTGALRWVFHTIPQPGEYGFNTWEDTTAYKHIGGANSWSGFSLDEARGILFAPTGSASFDFYGGKRKGNNLFANCVLALDAATGKRLWHFQTIHHDVWDKDIPTPPIAVTVTHEGQKIDAVAQTTKTGLVFLFNRVTGKPLFPIEEKPVPTETELNGEKLSPTQPIPTKPAPFARQVFTHADINPLLPDSSKKDIAAKLATYKTGNMFNPPSKQGTVILPGFDGGGEWGGPAFDPATGVLYVNANEMPWVLTMVDVKNQAPKKETWLDAGQRLYRQTCMACHGPERKGAGNAPTLIGVNKKYNEDQFKQLITGGRRMMPAFKQLTAEEQNAIASFILDVKARQHNEFTQKPAPVDTFLHLPYSITGYNKFLSKEGYNAMSPPWGTLNAIDLNKGEILWKMPLGEYAEFKDKAGITGTENYGGPVVTAGGLVFIAATRDSKIRAFNKATGKLLWEADLPAPGFAAPAVYQQNGKEYLVIACGGGKLGTKPGDAYVAFALP
ncbi:MAG TPA: pyrroloquinoline quinone-dependent dehydrogenase, partial [Chitinophagaceae bacterium]|nr:pyrroloquinoline quinone-dependent dehydrogenase [Chitinophagaceae bacterium]